MSGAARAITAAVTDNPLTATDITSFPGAGISGVVAGRRWLLGNASFIAEHCPQVELPDDIRDVAALTHWLQARDEHWQSALADPNLHVAVNQQIVQADTAIRDGDEIAWFPPVTGG